MSAIARARVIVEIPRRMCCFSRPVDSVSATKIFARGFPSGAGSERQFIVYSMTIKAREDLAMVLPIPVQPNSVENALRFINLADYPAFFAKLESGFPMPRVAAMGSVSLGARGLVVHEVGEFEASFVPTVADFVRLDRQFQLPEGTWEKLPQYRNYGFAVFKLKSGARTIHPMAFDFPRANPKSLFFPTVHIHDGTVHPRADFHHTLYCQRNSGESFPVTHWRESPALAGTFIDATRTQNIIDASQHCFRLDLQGTLKNADTVLS